MMKFLGVIEIIIVMLIQCGLLVSKTSWVWLRWQSIVVMMVTGRRTDWAAMNRRWNQIVVPRTWMIPDG